MICLTIVLPPVMNKPNPSLNRSIYHSYRSAFVGSTRDARRAGSQLANTATAIRPIEFRHRLIDHRDAGRSSAITLLDVTAEQQWDAEIREVAGADLVEPRPGVLLGAGRESFHFKPGRRLGAKEKSVLRRQAGQKCWPKAGSTCVPNISANTPLWSRRRS